MSADTATDWIFRDDPYARAIDARVVAVGDSGVVLDRTVFYPLGGGQPGDTGTLVRADGTRLAIVDTRKGAQGTAIVHALAPGAAMPVAGETVAVELDWARRYAHMRMHTACHLLCAALPFPVTGGSIRVDSARLDFDMPADACDKAKVGATLDAWIGAALPVGSDWIDDAELDAREDLVRTMAVAPPRGAGRVRLVRIGAIDLQACGGTHVRSTAEIGRIGIAKVENKGRQNRRVTIAFAG